LYFANTFISEGISKCWKVTFGLLEEEAAAVLIFKIGFGMIVPCLYRIALRHSTEDLLSTQAKIDFSVYFLFSLGSCLGKTSRISLMQPILSFF